MLFCHELADQMVLSLTANSIMLKERPENFLRWINQLSSSVLIPALGRLVTVLHLLNLALVTDAAGVSRLQEFSYFLMKSTGRSL